MTRLVHLANYPNPHPGSYIPLLLALFDGARERGWRPEAGFPASVAGAGWLEDFAAREIPVTLIPEGSRRDNTRAVAELLGPGEGPLVVHTHFTTYDIPAALALRGRPEAVLFWHIHTVLGAGLGSIARNSAKFALLGRRADRIVVPAANVGDELVRRRARRERIMLLPSPIDPAEYTPPDAEHRRTSRIAWDIPDDSPALLHIGRAWHLKGGDLYLQAARRLLDGGVPVTAMTLRGGEEAQHEAERLEIDAAVRVLPKVPEMRDLYAAADVFVAPSRGEGMPFSIVEALASGIPVVASDLPGHRYLGDRLAACTIADSDPDALAQAIGTMLARPADQAAREAQEAREWIAANLSLTAATAVLLDAYEAALAERRAGGR